MGWEGGPEGEAHCVEGEDDGLRRDEGLEFGVERFTGVL